ncbi:MAG TPA: hypothetical protein VFN38_11610 [Gemmatimonadaceae bacterium]|nr:hypothetical protein [Gemmatimonadaceae bacterium]
MLESLDFIYVPTGDVDAAAAHHQRVLGAELLWKVRAMGTTVAALRISVGGPQILLSGHLAGERPILVYRVADYQAAVATLRANGLTEIDELEIPHGPCAVFRLDGGQRYAIYQLIRPNADEHFAGRFDE